MLKHMRMPRSLIKCNIYYVELSFQTTYKLIGNLSPMDEEVFEINMSTFQITSEYLYFVTPLKEGQS